MLLYKYSPKTTSELIGNRTALLSIKGFLAKWSKGKALLVHGQAGSGKSSSLKLIAKDLGYQVHEINGSEKVDVNNLIRSSGQQGVFHRKKIILAEDIDTKSIKLTELVRSSSHPVICTAQDAYKLRPDIRRLFTLVKFDKVKEVELLNFLLKICEKEKLKITERDIGQLARMSDGDVRSALIDLETLRIGTSIKEIGYRNLEDNVFNTIRMIFKTMSIENSRHALEKSEKDAEEIFHWLEENIKEEYDLKSLAAAYDYLSKADIFYSRIIRRQSWSLQKYFAGIAVYGTALAKEKASMKFVAYKPPKFYRRMSASALEKLARPLHTSRSKSVAYIPLIRAIAKKSDICEDLGMDEKEIASITQRL